MSKLNQKIYKKLEIWRNEPIEGDFPYIYLDCIVPKRTWAGEEKNVPVLVAIGVDKDGYRRILGVQKGHKEDKSGWSESLAYLKHRGLKGVKLIISDAQSDLSAREFRGGRPKSHDVCDKLRGMKLPKAAELIEERINETLTYNHFPTTHWTRIRSNNPLEWLIREIRRRTRVVGAFPDGQSAHASGRQTPSRAGTNGARDATFAGRNCTSQTLHTHNLPEASLTNVRNKVDVVRPLHSPRATPQRWLPGWMVKRQRTGSAR